MNDYVFEYYVCPCSTLHCIVSYSFWISFRPKGFPEGANLKPELRHNEATPINTRGIANIIQDGSMDMCVCDVLSNTAAGNPHLANYNLWHMSVCPYTLERRLSSEMLLLDKPAVLTTVLNPIHLVRQYLGFQQTKVTMVRCLPYNYKQELCLSTRMPPIACGVKEKCKHHH